MIILKKIFSDVYLIKNKFNNDNRSKFFKFNNEIMIKKKRIKFNQFCYSLNKKNILLEVFIFKNIHTKKQNLLHVLREKF